MTLQGKGGSGFCGGPAPVRPQANCFTTFAQTRCLHSASFTGPPFPRQPRFLQEAALHLWQNSMNSFTRLPWKESKVIPAESPKGTWSRHPHLLETDRLTSLATVRPEEFWHPCGGSPEANPVPAVSEMMPGMAGPGPLPRLGPALKYLCFGLF